MNSGIIENWFASDSHYQKLVELYFNADVCKQIKKHLLSDGKLGGKTIGLLLAGEILKRDLHNSLVASVRIPQSYFIGSDEFVRLIAQEGPSRQLNGMQSIDYDELEKAFIEASLSEELTKKIKIMLGEIGECPIVVRSSSILEDQYGSSFAGIYRSVFCPNQGDILKRIHEIESAIKQVYASTFSADAISYKRQKGLDQTSEEMAILIQLVEGQTNDGLYFPTASGIAFSENPYCWTERLNPEDGFLRIVWGLGSQAVRTLPGDYSRLIGLTNPRLRPENTGDDLYYYSQHHFDAINLETGLFETLPVTQFLKDSYPYVRDVASILDAGGLHRIKSALKPSDQLVVTFDQMIDRTALSDTLAQCLRILAEKIGGLINIEFSVNLNANNFIDIGILQCRRLAWDTASDHEYEQPEQKNIILRTNRFLYSGEKQGIEYIIFVDPDFYNKALPQGQQYEVARIIGKLNQILGDKGFLLAGPGRWGSVQPDLGVPVKFADIYNAKALLEIHQSPGDIFSATYGTHFFLDLVEAKIALLTFAMSSEDQSMNLDFFKKADNILDEFMQGAKVGFDGIKMFRVPFNQEINIIASPLKRIALAFLKN
jgi:hypothetical protein